MTHDEWGLIRPLRPPAKRGGNTRTLAAREVVNGLMYILSYGLLPVGVTTEGPAAAQHRE